MAIGALCAKIQWILSITREATLICRQLGFLPIGETAILNARAVVRAVVNIN